MDGQNPIPAKDKLGREIESEALWPIFHATTHAELQRDIQKLRKAIEALCESRLGVHLHHQTIDGHLKRAWAELKFSAPYAPCCHCRAQGCKVCHKQGWIPKLIYDNVPGELK